MIETDGAQLCARFAYKPSFLRLCGNDLSSRAAYNCIVNGGDSAFRESLSSYRVLYPYLKIISDKHHLDILDFKVAEAYWIGNELTEDYSRRDFSKFLKYLKQQGTPKEFIHLIKSEFDRRGMDFLPHHSFNVFFIGNVDNPVNSTARIDFMNNCLIRTGKVISMSEKGVEVETKRMIKNVAQPSFVSRIESAEVDYKLIQPFEISSFIALHWNSVSSVLTQKQSESLEYYNSRLLEISF